MYVSNKHELSSRLTPTDQQNSTSSSIPITPAPSSTVSTSTASSSPPVAGSSRKSVPVAAIAAPVVIGVLADATSLRIALLTVVAAGLGALLLGGRLKGRIGEP